MSHPSPMFSFIFYFVEALEDLGAVSTSANLVALSFDLLYTVWCVQIIFAWPKKINFD